MEKWEMDLREEIRGALKSSPSTPPKKTKIQIRPLMFFAAVLLFVMSFAVAERKQPGFFADKIGQCVSYFDRDAPVQNNQPDPLILALQGLDSRLEALEAKEEYTDEELKAELKELRDKVYLMVVVQDENAAISKKILSQYNYEGQQFIHIDPDWKINRMPTHIKLTPESEEFLRERLK
jgi:hypothetical protein